MSGMSPRDEVNVQALGIRTRAENGRERPQWRTSAGAGAGGGAGAEAGGGAEAGADGGAGAEAGGGADGARVRRWPYHLR